MNTTRIEKRLREETGYQEFFQKAMEKFDITSPTDLKDPEKKKNFFYTNLDICFLFFHLRTHIIFMNRVKKSFLI